MLLVVHSRLDEMGAVGLISLIIAVREVVADQLGVNTGSVITAEVSRLLHLTVKVEVEISTTLLLEIPAVFSQGNDCRLVCEGKYLVFVISINNFPSERSGGENHSRKTQSQQLSLRIEKIKPVNVTLRANS